MKEYECEFGSSFPVNFIDAKMYDEFRNEIKPICKCGKEGKTCVTGTTWYIWLCEDCINEKKE